MILVTRTAQKLPETLADYTPTFGQNKVLGFAVSSTTPQKIKIPSGVQGLIITSSAAISALPASAKNLPVYCVGGATAKAAIKAGFQASIVGETDGQALAEQIVREISPCHLFHPTADTAKTNYYAHLKTFRFTISSATAYTTQFAEILPEQITSHWPQITHCLFFSARSASHFCTLVAKKGLKCEHITALALSPQVAAAVQGFSKIEIAKKPTKEAMKSGIRQTN